MCNTENIYGAENRKQISFCFEDWKLYNCCSTVVQFVCYLLIYNLLWTIKYLLKNKLRILAEFQTDSGLGLRWRIVMISRMMFGWIWLQSNLSFITFKQDAWQLSWRCNYMLARGQLSSLLPALLHSFLQTSPRRKHMEQKRPRSSE